MGVELKPLSQQTLVITGASSGIGLATACLAAERGARVVLAARNEEILREVERRIVAQGGQAVHVSADVADRGAVQRIADRAHSAFGGFDTWVNNAGVDIWGRIVDVPERDARRLFETNFWGLVNGSLVAIDTLRRQGGALINLGSVESDRGFPQQGMYTASKHAVKGFTDVLRMELEEEGAPVSVTLVKPGAIATPLQEKAANYMDREIQLPPPLYAPEEVAEVILHAAVHPQRDVHVGGAAKALALLHGHAPRVLDKISETLFTPAQQRSEENSHRPSNLHSSQSEGEVYAEDPGYPVIRSGYNRARMHPLLTLGLLAGGGWALNTLLRGVEAPERRAST